jgi:hypothetical protein
MPRVTPSQVVSLIDRLFELAPRQARGEAIQFSVDLSHLTAVGALLEMIRQIPVELLQLDRDQLPSYMVAVAALHAAIPAWQAGNRHLHVTVVRGIGNNNLNPVTVIRQSLSLCPDEFRPVSPRLRPGEPGGCRRPEIVQGALWGVHPSPAPSRNCPPLRGRPRGPPFAAYVLPLRAAPCTVAVR